jgi:phage baseplate assembly protein W
MADYVDLDYSMERNQFGGIDFKEDAEAVKQSMIDILLTKVGEREYMPLYGSKIHTILMEKMNEITTIRLRDEIKVALENWEPRINITDVEIIKYPDQNFYEVFIYFDLLRLSESDVLNLQLNRVS